MSAFQNYFMDTIKNRYADFDGRARRSEFWYFLLFYMAITFGVMIVAGGLAMISPELGLVAPVLLIILSLGLLIPNLALCIRRLHDTNKSGWMLLIGFIPLVGSIILIVFYATEGDRGQNQYGPDPKSLGTGGGNLGDDILA
jgi:uncharacterized membrane protein YhaH (DUF805 family)